MKLAESWTILEPREVGQLVNPKKNEVGPNPGRKLDNEWTQGSKSMCEPLLGVYIVLDNPPCKCKSLICICVSVSVNA
jgi:hypothetical protein